MRDEWYGDKRDLVKWGSLLHIAQRYQIDRLVQVGYVRSSTWDSLEIDGETYPIPSQVIQHFRDLRTISTLVSCPRIHVVDTLWGDRASYTREVLNLIASCGSERLLVFLDPDTGLAPQRTDLTHVLASEILDIWRHMGPGDVLVLYQHQTNRRGCTWIEPKRAEFEIALGLPEGAAKIAHAPKIAHDAVLFFCQKEEEAPSSAE